MADLERYFETNREMWDKFAKAHLTSKAYKTEEFLQGKTTLNSIELEEVGDVKGKTMLHLQCHFGLDTLSWAREGAIVTGVDFSGVAIDLARKLAEESSVDARFIQANIYDLPNLLDEKFDIVFTSYGVHCWLNDLNRWAEIAAFFLKSDGLFYIVENHPLMWVFDWDARDDFRLARSYFHSPEPYEFQVDASYAGPKIDAQSDYEWAHGLGSVITAIVNADLRIEFLHEFPISPTQQFPFLIQREDGYWVYKNSEIQLPLVYSIRAVKIKE
ncbi:MAG: class I SAM-dependent methyltransferase [Candidatus Thorarchaeota archaeon]|nr:class I SAM-dependent methyltransferase [Candidatus Thorarchaeota archaeon]